MGLSETRRVTIMGAVWELKQASATVAFPTNPVPLEIVAEIEALPAEDIGQVLSELAARFPREFQGSARFCLANVS